MLGSRRLADQDIAPSAPDEFVAAVTKDAAPEGGDVEVVVTLHQLAECGTDVVGHEPAIDPGKSDFVEPQPVRHVWQLVGDDDRPAGLDHAYHLAERGFRVVEVVEAADAQDGIELPVAER